jgi:hypothetical protein
MLVQLETVTMKNTGWGVAGVILVLTQLAATVCLFSLKHAVSKWVDLVTAMLGMAVISLVGCGIGWSSFKTRAGRAAAIIGTLLFLFLLVQLLRSAMIEAESSPSFQLVP